METIPDRSRAHASQMLFDRRIRLSRESENPEIVELQAS